MMIILLIFLGLLPSLAWLWFYLMEDPFPEPPRKLFLAFLGGILMAPIIYSFEKLFLGPFGVNWEIAGAGLGITLGSFLIVSIVEETGKYFGAWLSTRGNSFFDEPIDAMIYMVTAALGFAAAENFAFIFTAFSHNANIAGALEILTLRFFGATFLHTLASAALGYYWAKMLLTGKRRFIFYGFLAAIALHTFFNWSIIILNELTVYIGALLIGASILILHDFQVLKKKHINLLQKI